MISATKDRRGRRVENEFSATKDRRGRRVENEFSATKYRSGRRVAKGSFSHKGHKEHKVMENDK